MKLHTPEQVKGKVGRELPCPLCSLDPGYPDSWVSFPFFPFYHLLYSSETLGSTLSHLLGPLNLGLC